jgi:ADP-ribose pyrophosphatase YjhB (NUDIX family)
MLANLVQDAIFLAQWLTRRLTLGAVAVMVREEEILLVRSRYRTGWHLPGGFIEPPESVEDGIRREVREETGYRLESAKLVGVIGGRRKWALVGGYTVVFLSSDFSVESERQPDWEIAEARWFDRRSLPADLNEFVAGCIWRALGDPS